MNLSKIFTNGALAVLALGGVALLDRMSSNPVLSFNKDVHASDSASSANDVKIVMRDGAVSLEYAAK